MTQEDRDTLRGVAGPLQNLMNEILAEAPLKEAKEVISGVHSDSTLAHCASVTLGYVAFAQAIQRLLSLKGPKAAIGVNVMARTLADVPKDYRQ